MNKPLLSRGLASVGALALLVAVQVLAAVTLPAGTELISVAHHAASTMMANHGNVRRQVSGRQCRGHRFDSD